MQILDSVALALGVLAPPTFAVLVAGTLLAQVGLGLHRRRNTRLLERLAAEARVKKSSTARQLHEYMEEYDRELLSLGDHARREALQDAYRRYRTRQESAIRHLDVITQEAARLNTPERGPELVAHQVLDYFANQQAAR